MRPAEPIPNVMGLDASHRHVDLPALRHPSGWGSYPPSKRRRCRRCGYGEAHESHRVATRAVHLAKATPRRGLLVETLRSRSRSGTALPVIYRLSPDPETGHGALLGSCARRMAGVRCFLVRALYEVMGSAARRATRPGQRKPALLQAPMACVWLMASWLVPLPTAPPPLVPRSYPCTAVVPP